jgi:hypothetical protein
MNAPASHSSPSAVASLVFGVLAWTVLPVIGAIVAIACGHIARAEIRRAPPGSLDGDGMAVAGLVLGWLQVGFGLLVLTFLFGLVGLLAAFGGTH